MRRPRKEGRLGILILGQWFSMGVNFAPHKTLWRHFWMSQLGEKLEATDAVKPSAMHRTAPHNKELSSPKWQFSQQEVGGQVRWERLVPIKAKKENVLTNGM